jgi:hypothetical protein
VVGSAAGPGAAGCDSRWRGLVVAADSLSCLCVAAVRSSLG